MRATEIGMPTDRREQMVEITPRLNELIQEQGWREGILHIYVPHTTAGVCINENADPNVAADVLTALARLAPQDAGWAKEEPNSDAHVKSAVLGSHEVVPVVGGRLQLGRWQGVFLGEFDGPRDRLVRLYFLEG